MFPDEQSEWDGYPSVLDGIERPHVSVIGGPTGWINLLIEGERDKAYAVQAPVMLHWVVDEYEYSVSGHGLPSLAYLGATYVKRARKSKLLDAYGSGAIAAMVPRVQHFAFVGGTDCVEVVTQGDLTISALPSRAARNDWIRDVSEEIRKSFSSDT